MWCCLSYLLFLMYRNILHAWLHKLTFILFIFLLFPSVANLNVCSGLLQKVIKAV